eukprot:6491285-Amphidinium_carterae.2
MEPTEETLSALQAQDISLRGDDQTLTEACEGTEAGAQMWEQYTKTGDAATMRREMTALSAMVARLDTRIEQAMAISVRLTEFELLCDAMRLKLDKSALPELVAVVKKKVEGYHSQASWQAVCLEEDIKKLCSRLDTQEAALQKEAEKRESTMHAIAEQIEALSVKLSAEETQDAEPQWRAEMKEMEWRLRAQIDQAKQAADASERSWLSAEQHAWREAMVQMECRLQVQIDQAKQEDANSERRGLSEEVDAWRAEMLDMECRLQQQLEQTKRDLDTSERRVLSEEMRGLESRMDGQLAQLRQGWEAFSMKPWVEGLSNVESRLAAQLMQLKEESAGRPSQKDLCELEQRLDRRLINLDRASESRGLLYAAVSRKLRDRLEFVEARTADAKQMQCTGDAAVQAIAAEQLPTLIATPVDDTAGLLKRRRLIHR